MAVGGRNQNQNNPPVEEKKFDLGEKYNEMVTAQRSAMIRAIEVDRREGKLNKAVDTSLRGAVGQNGIAPNQEKFLSNAIAEAYRTGHLPLSATAADVTAALGRLNLVV